MDQMGKKHLQLPKRILIFAAPCQRLSTAVVVQGILYSTDVHEQIDVDQLLSIITRERASTKEIANVRGLPRFPSLGLYAEQFAPDHGGGPNPLSTCLSACRPI